MHSESTFELFNHLKGDSFDLIYLGEFDDELTGVFLDINDATKSEVKPFKKKISFLIAECFQNIIRHSDSDSENKMSVTIPKMFMLRNTGELHHIVTSNLIANSEQDNLSKMFASLENLNQKELKSMYLNALINNKHSAKGGAGLGLIEMARKSGTVPTFNFVNITEEYSNFFMQVNILPIDYEGQIEMEDISLDSAKNIYKSMNRQEILLVQKGDFSQDTIVPLIQLFENNLSLKEESLAIKKKALYILIEMLQNITRHSNKISGQNQAILVVKKVETTDYLISTGNFISNQEGQLLIEQLDSIADLNKIELTKKYKEQLTSKKNEKGKGAGIGLIEICRNSSERIQYHLNSTENDLSFFTLTVKL